LGTEFEFEFQLNLNEISTMAFGKKRSEPNSGASAQSDTCRNSDIRLSKGQGTSWVQFGTKSSQARWHLSV